MVLPLLLGPLLTLMAGGGQAMLTQFRLDRALHAALMAAWYTPSLAPATVQAQAQLGYGAGSSPMTPTVTYACRCIVPTSTYASGIVTACNGTCGSGQVLGTWVTATMTASFTPLLTMTWGSGAWTLSSTGTVRVK